MIKKYDDFINEGKIKPEKVVDAINDLLGTSFNVEELNKTLTAKDREMNISFHAPKDFINYLERNLLKKYKIKAEIDAWKLFGDDFNFTIKIK